MPDRLLHRTWSVRTVSPFVRTLRIGGPSPLPLSGGGDGAVGSIGAVSGGASASANANTNSGTSPAETAAAQASHQSADADGSTNTSSSKTSSQECRWFPTLSELAEEMTNRLRACPDLVDSSTNSSAAAASASSSLGFAGIGLSSGGGSGMLEIGGTYAALTWIDLDEAALRGRDHDLDAMDITTTSGGSPPAPVEGGGAGGASSSGRKRSRRRRNSNRRCMHGENGSRDGSSQKHLHVEVRINDEPAGQILLCSAEVVTAAAAASTPSSSAAASAAAAAAHDPAFLSPIHSQYYSHHEPVHIRSFSYLLLRGKMKALQPVLLYLESALGCAVGTRPFAPSPADVAASLSNWMVGTVVEQRRQRRRVTAERLGRKSIGSGGSGGNGSGNGNGSGMMDDDMGIGAMGSILTPGGSTTAASSMANKKPLELTLAVPPHLVRAGLERITVTVPPVSLTRLCAVVERKRPLPSSAPGGKGGSRCSGAITPLMVTDSEKDDESSGYRPGSGAAAVGSAVATATTASNANDGLGTADHRQLKTPNDNDTQQQIEQVDQDEDLPILRALQCYLYEAFHIDARQLHVVKAATAHAVVGTDGRIKPLTVEALPSLLDDIGMMVRRATGARALSECAEAEESSG